MDNEWFIPPGRAAPWALAGREAASFAANAVTRFARKGAEPAKRGLAGPIENLIWPALSRVRKRRMGATLDALFRLQKIEHQLRSVRGQIESRNRRVTAQKRRIATLEQQINEQHQSAIRAQSEAGSLELERKTHEAHIAKLREALNQAKSNKDYAAILTQLNTDKADALRLEDRVLSGLTKVDEFKKKSDEIKVQLRKEQARLAELEKDVADHAAQLAGDLQNLEAQREEAAEAVGPENLHSFERACERHDGEGMAVVERVHPRQAEYICTGCHMSVPLERINSLQTKDEVQLCPNCLRILCLDAPAGAMV
jgi:uncharacterized protein